VSDHVKHIRHTYVPFQGRAWRGRTLTSFDWQFQDLDHAAYNAGRTVACRSCVKAAVRALTHTAPEPIMASLLTGVRR
jgi:hypothetical protein